ncbi:hypothetical protein MIND_01352200 [Mycena indigotica]|uniref:Uncharacterized protein n=1 Tax=Mycena indigotica TaxID=2126181 RepID=A0A8H6S0H3_9AGAR|nr:uncharacterized protein MIND_01352200 [Mycena indigotica]KAF7289781.1 hypothetical protein MIND_01352200 [Mycena indigotica]
MAPSTAARPPPCWYTKRATAKPPPFSDAWPAALLRLARLGAAAGTGEAGSDQGRGTNGSREVFVGIVHVLEAVETITNRDVRTAFKPLCEALLRAAQALQDSLSPGPEVAEFVELLDAVLLTVRAAQTAPRPPRELRRAFRRRSAAEGLVPVCKDYEMRAGEFERRWVEASSSPTDQEDGELAGRDDDDEEVLLYTAFKFLAAHRAEHGPEDPVRRGRSSQRRTPPGHTARCESTPRRPHSSRMRRTAAFGPDHGDTLRAAEALARTRAAQGDFVGTERLEAEMSSNGGRRHSGRGTRTH